MSAADLANGAAGGAAQPREVELKYRVVDADAVGVLLELPAIGPFTGEGTVETDETLDRFLDTPDDAFRAAQHALRLRRVGDATILTIKGPSTPGPGGAVSRTEVEATVDGDDPASWPPSPARELVESIGHGQPLREIARLAQRRRHRLLRDGATVVELTVDDVEVRDRDRPIAAWLELEAELRDGEPDALEELAAALVAGGGLEPSPESKFAAALRALEQARAASRSRARQPPADVPLGDLARSIVLTQLARVGGHEPAARAGDDEALHKMRVATRRMRAAWAVFEDVLPKASGLRRDVRDLARALGAVRDLDVLGAYLAAVSADAAEADCEGLGRLAADWSARRDAGAERLSALLDTQAQHRLPDLLRAALAKPSGSRAHPAVRRVRDAAASRTWAAYETVRVYEPVLRWADTPTLHQLRIEGKRLRYTLEFFSPALGTGSAPLIARTVALQDLLGSLHDEDVAAGLARTFLIERNRDLTTPETAAIGRFVARAERDMRRHRAAVPRTWRGVGGATFRRSLGRLLAAL
jgi:CHAD domain-containing protein/adenylate cyclase class IV